MTSVCLLRSALVLPFPTSNTSPSAKRTTLLAWIKKARLRGRRKVKSEREASSDEANTADLDDIAEKLEKANEADTNGTVEETPSLGAIQRATDVLAADEAAGSGKLPPQLPISAWGRVDTVQQVGHRTPLVLRGRGSAGMDPLVAAHMHSANHSPIYRMPEELVLEILRCLASDQLAILCLRRVATKFRRIIDDPELWKDIRVNYLYRSSGRIRELEALFPKDIREELWRRIHKDGMCDKCRRLRPGTPPRGSPEDAGWPGHCPVVSRSPLSLHCDGRGGGHDARQCRGRHAAVRLCEHVKISWADMEPYLSEWQQQQDAADRQTCLAGFSIECCDPGQDTRCRAEDPPTWPRASLETTKGLRASEWVVVLTLKWQPHSGFNVFSITSNGRAPASEIRTMFQRYRQGAAEILFPSSPQLPFPEMACFRDTKCRCLDYE